MNNKQNYLIVNNVREDVFVNDFNAFSSGEIFDIRWKQLNSCGRPFPLLIGSYVKTAHLFPLFSTASEYLLNK